MHTHNYILTNLQFYILKFLHDSIHKYITCKWGFVLLVTVFWMMISRLLSLQINFIWSLKPSFIYWFDRFIFVFVKIFLYSSTVWVLFSFRHNNRVVFLQWIRQGERSRRKSSWFSPSQRRTEAREGDEWIHELDL